MKLFTFAFIMAGLMLLGGCATRETFQLPYGEVVSELQALYPPPGAQGDRNIEEPRIPGSETPPITTGSVRYRELTPGAIYRIEINTLWSLGHKKTEITIRKVDSTTTQVTVSCERTIRYSRTGPGQTNRDIEYEQFFLHDIRSRLKQKKAIKAKQDDVFL